MNVVVSLVSLTLNQPSNCPDNGSTYTIKTVSILKKTVKTIRLMRRS